MSAAEALLSLDDAAKQLLLNKDQVVELVKKGMLRAFRDQNTYKFRPADVEAYKKKVATSITEISTGDATEVRSAVKEPASKIDLTEIDSDPAIDESDQTSVMAPAEDADDRRAQKTEETPVFKFAEKDLGLDEELPAVDEADQTSLLAPAEEAGEKDKKDGGPSFDFAEKDLNLTLDDEGGDSVLVADESESSVDILEVAEESSSDSSSSASHMGLADESSGEEVEAITHLEESPQPMAPVGSTDKTIVDNTVADILGAAEEDSSEELESLNLDEMIDTHEVAAADPDHAGVDIDADVDLDQKPADTTDTVPIADEAETVGIAVGDDIPVGGAETAAVSDAVAAALDSVAAEEGVEEAAAEPDFEAEAEAEPGQVVVPAGWQTVTPSKLYNGALIAAMVLALVGGAVLFAEMLPLGADNVFSKHVLDIGKQIGSMLPK